MIDRQSRDRLVQIIESYLDEEITAFQFDESIFTVADDTEDQTVNHVVEALWYHYDDCTDHTVALTKEQWDYFQRLLLLLKSDAEIEIERRHCWSWRQLAAAITLLCFVLIAVPLGFGLHLHIVAIPFGVVSLILSKTRQQPTEQDIKQLTALVPFDSTGQLLTIRRSVAGFQKTRYPPALTKKRIRSAFLERAYTFETTALWLLYSPLVLLVQILPSSKEKVVIVMP